jgi:hypothetical protein
LKYFYTPPKCKVIRIEVLKDLPFIPELPGEGHNDPLHSISTMIILSASITFENSSEAASASQLIWHRLKLV